MKNCPCGSSKNSLNCCLLFISGKATPTTPEELMRSRYTAYTQANMDYIVKTMKAPANHNFNPEDAYQWAKQVTWIKLEIVQTQLNQATGIVEFRAHFSYQDKRQVLHEISEFSFENNQWYYVDGKMPH